MMPKITYRPADPYNAKCREIKIRVDMTDIMRNRDALVAFALSLDAYDSNEDWDRYATICRLFQMAMGIAASQDDIILWYRRTYL